MAKNTPAQKLDKKPIVQEKVETKEEKKLILSDTMEVQGETIAINTIADTSLAVAPYRLRARQDTTFMKFDGKKLLYQDSYVRGQEVIGAEKVFDILASKQANQFIKINVRAD